ncbi:MAG: hypothetical protein HY275_11175 [Gemmatimonadetes bacterium]|nr:hypothetical protein [Gemmatimonadota bacterium]
MPFLFASAIDTRAPLLANGERADQLDRSGHYARWEDDFAIAHRIGLDALFYGPAYYRAHVSPGHYDWDTCAEPMERLRLLGITPIADLAHAGVPAWMSGVGDPAFPEHFADYARAFARRFPWVTHFAPVRALVDVAQQSAFDGRWNEARTGDAAFLRTVTTMARAHELAVAAIVAERPDATIVMSAPAVHAHAAGEGARAEAERRNARRWLGLDLCLGATLGEPIHKALLEAGVSEAELRFFREKRPARAAERILSVAWAPDAERRLTSGGRETSVLQRLGLRHLGTRLHERYALPLLCAETHAPSRHARAWLKQQWDDVLSLRAAGVRVAGFGWSPLTDGPRLQAGPRVMEDTGLAEGTRALKPVGELFRDLVARWRPVLAEPLGGAMPRPARRRAGSAR